MCAPGAPAARNGRCGGFIPFLHETWDLYSRSNLGRRSVETMALTLPPAAHRLTWVLHALALGLGLSFAAMFFDKSLFSWHPTLMALGYLLFLTEGIVTASEAHSIVQHAEHSRGSQRQRSDIWTSVAGHRQLSSASCRGRARGSGSAASSICILHTPRGDGLKHRAYWAGAGGGLCLGRPAFDEDCHEGCHGGQQAQL